MKAGLLFKYGTGLVRKDNEKGCTENDFRRIRYSMRIWILQENLELSLMDARIYTRRERPESIEEITAFFGTDTESVESRIPEIESKVEAALERDPNFFHGYEPVFPEDKIA